MGTSIELCCGFWLMDVNIISISPRKISEYVVNIPDTFWWYSDIFLGERSGCLPMSRLGNRALSRNWLTRLKKKMINPQNIPNHWLFWIFFLPKMENSWKISCYPSNHYEVAELPIKNHVSKPILSPLKPATKIHNEKPQRISRGSIPCQETQTSGDRTPCTEGSGRILEECAAAGEANARRTDIRWSQLSHSHDGSILTYRTHRIHGAGIYANMTGVYWWDPC